jgi:hypothetical protein
VGRTRFGASMRFVFRMVTAVRGLGKGNARPVTASGVGLL